jgi:PAS domain S-box-containing protein
MSSANRVATLCVDADGRISSADAGAEALFADSREALRGRPLVDFVELPPEEGDPERACKGRTAAGASLALTVTRTRHVLGGADVSLFVIRDAAAAASLSNQSDELHFLQTVLDAIPAPVFYKNTEGIYLGCNRAFEVYRGLVREDLVGRSVFGIAPRDLAQAYFEADAQLLAEGPGAVQTYEARVMYADKSQHDVIFYKANFTNREGELAGLVGTLLDITGRKEVERQLAAAKEDSERLLRSVLPESIATRLKKSPGVIADSFPEATVLFADVVGFTTLAARMSAAELVRVLNMVFSRFDAIAADFGAEKIKTIGDAYMVVAGVPEARTDHVEVVADVGLAMRTAIREVTAQAGVPMELRLGMHTGPVVAGVIGTHKFLYDLWGDTVNTASRMESHGVVGEIQVSEVVRERLADRYAFADRGVVAIKGKGDMRTFLLQGRLGDEPLAAARER